MRRVRLIVWAMLMLCYWAVPATARQVRFDGPVATAAPTPAVPAAEHFCPICWYFGFTGEDYDSSHQDGGNFGMTRKLSWSPGKLNTAFVAEFRAEHEWDSTYALHFLAGLRWVNDTRFKYPYFYEVTTGVAQYPGETVFEVHPSFGILFPREGSPWGFYTRVGLPIEFFSGNAEWGTEFAVGMTYGKR